MRSVRANWALPDRRHPRPGLCNRKRARPFAFRQGALRNRRICFGA